MDKDGGACTKESLHRRKSPRLNPSCSANASLPPRPPPKTTSNPSVTKQVQQESEGRHGRMVRTRSGALIWMGPRPPRVVRSAVPSQTKAAAPQISQPPVQTEQSAAHSLSAAQPPSSRSPPRGVGIADPSGSKAAAPQISQPPVTEKDLSAAQSLSAAQLPSSRSPPRGVGSADPSGSKAAAPQISQPPVTEKDLSAAQSLSATPPPSSRSPPRGVGSADPSQLKAAAAAAPQISISPIQTEQSAAQSPSAVQTGSSWSPPPVVEMQMPHMSQTKSNAGWPDSQPPVQTEPDSTRDSTWPSWDGTNRSPNMENWEGAELSPNQGCADQSSEPSDEQCQDGQSSEPHFYAGVDDGGRRCILRRPLRECREALAACGQELVESASEVSAGQNKRKRNKEKSDVRCGRGLAKPRDPVAPGDRPELLVVGDGEFTSRPMCTKVITTIRILTLENLPGPFRSYKMFPTKARLLILQQFMQRYSWGHEEDIKRCLDIFENIAAEAYSRELTETRATCKKKHGVDKEVWKNHPPRWCKNVEAWKSLCDIWSTTKWDQISTTNRENRTKSPDVISETGQSVGLLDVFDRTHTRRSEEGKVYVNTRAQAAAESFRNSKAVHGDKKKEYELWEEVVKGEDKRGRLFGFGNKSRTKEATRVLETVEASFENPTKSTATSADSQPRKYTENEVSHLLAAERKEFASSLAAQQERHKSEMDEMRKHNEFIRRCFGQLFSAQGIDPPQFNARPFILSL
ncbi:Plant transposase (Ptta/En/Spm family) [Carex littledalei]|uniref:Plant transposase (Ptta/En/Spm family) n=1 Tax=Carex littledalei TaxID=544730 RepID=A0A833VI10_9POAL|nr:Plant transposase (Ptta/En/Spm family) [Carex littledalei]